MIVIWIGLGLWAYTYVGYPALLQLLAARRRATPLPAPPETWPPISIAIPAYNEATSIAETIEAVLAIDYPADRRQVLVISDASSDGTDEIVARFASRGVELLRMSQRRGKTAAENSARSMLTGEIVVQTDASVRIHPAAIKHLVAAFADPKVGLASSRDVSVARLDASANPGEGAYVGYEMWVRGLETRVNSIVGASGSLYATRALLHQQALPDALSRDFAAALVARKFGYRSVSVPAAICFVPRGASLHQEYSRKVRTMTRGLGTLLYMKDLLNPFRHGSFAWMLASHKLCRWLLPWASVAIVVALAVEARQSSIARIMLAAALSGGLVAMVGWLWPAGRRVPRIVSIPAFAASGIFAGLNAWYRVFAGRLAPTWEPTRRGNVAP